MEPVMDKTLGPTAENSVAKAAANAKFSWKGGPAMKQAFTFQDTLIYYIAMNPSNPKVYNKLIQTCKYFFEVNPVITALNMIDETICSNTQCSEFERCCVKIDITKITSKIWITNYIYLRQNSVPNFAALLRSKIFRCDIYCLGIYNTTVDFEDFKFLGLSAKHIDLRSAKVIYNDGNPVMLENILETLPPNVEKFLCEFENNSSMVSASTAKNMSKIKNLGNLKKLVLRSIPQPFFVHDLFAFLKDHNGIKFELKFAAIDSEEYQNQLDQFVDLLIESQLSNCYIFYMTQNLEKSDILGQRFNAY